MGAGVGTSATAASAVGDLAEVGLGSALQRVDLSSDVTGVYCASEIDVSEQPATARPGGNDRGSALAMTACRK